MGEEHRGHQGGVGEVGPRCDVGQIELAVTLGEPLQRGAVGDGGDAGPDAAPGPGPEKAHRGHGQAHREPRGGEPEEERRLPPRAPRQVPRRQHRREQRERRQHQQAVELAPLGHQGLDPWKARSALPLDPWRFPQGALIVALHRGQQRRCRGPRFWLLGRADHAGEMLASQGPLGGAGVLGMQQPHGRGRPGGHAQLDLDLFPLDGHVPERNPGQDGAPQLVRGEEREDLGLPAGAEHVGVRRCRGRPGQQEEQGQQQRVQGDMHDEPRAGPLSPGGRGVQENPLVLGVLVVLPPSWVILQ